MQIEKDLTIFLKFPFSTQIKLVFSQSGVGPSQSGVGPSNHSGSVKYCSFLDRWSSPAVAIVYFKETSL